MRKWWPLVAVCLGTLMLLIDVTILTVALPDIAVGLHASAAGLQWVIDIYALGLAALLLGIGSLADQFGRRRVYLAGLVLFAAASLACALAPDAAALITARAVQAVGAAAMFATTIALLSVSYSGRERGVAFGVWGAVSGVAAALGPIAGGLLTEYLSWRWIFLVNLPVSVAAVALTLRVLPASRAGGPVRVDLPGVATFTLATGAFTYALTRVSADGWTSAAVDVPLVLAAVALAGFVAVEHRRASPLLDLALFRRPAFTGLMIGSALISASAFAYLVYSSLWLQSVLGRSAIEAGLNLVPMSVSSLVVSVAIGRFLHGWAPRWPVGGGLLLIGAGALLQTVVKAGSTGTVLLPGLIVSGVGVGLAIPPLSSAALGMVPPERSGMAGGAVTTFRQLGYALGIAVSGVIFQSRAANALRGRAHLADAAAESRALAAGQGDALIAHAQAGQRAATGNLVHAAAASALSQVCLVAGTAGVLGGVLVIILLRRPYARPATPRPAGDSHLSTAGDVASPG